MNKFTCKDCNREFDTYKGYQNHNSKTHKITGAETYVNVHFNGEWPVCECGCGQKLNFQLSKFGKYIVGHKTRVNGGFYSPLGAKRSGETRKKRFASGELIPYNRGKKYTEEEYKKLEAVWKSPERAKKISEKLTGKKKSPEHVAKIKADRQKYWGDQNNRDAQSERRMQYIIKHGLGHSSKLEDLFKEILNSLNIEFIHQFYAPDIKSLYDFKIKGKNILIEVDGDYWHCNPNIEKFKTPVHEWHYENIKRDEKKNKWAEENGYTLLRFWEHDIQNNRLEVIQTLIDLLSS